MKKLSLIGFGFLAALFLACGDDNSTSNTEEVVGPDGKVIPDSILYSDSLYTWYLEQFGKDKPESSGSNKPTSSSGDSTDVASSSSSGIALDEKLVEASKVHLLPPAGFYSELTIPVPAPLYGGIIRCTFDGSEPSEETEEFTEPYRIIRNTPVRCAEFAGDTIARKSSHTFFIKEQVSMPVVAITVDSAFFITRYGNTSDCFGENPYGCRLPIMVDAEFPVHVEFFENGSASTKKTWQIDAGISLMGNYSRTYAKKPVAIKMKKIYEDGRLKYNLFSTRPEDNKFKGFNLRNGGNRFVGDFVADPAMVSVVEGSGVDYQRSRQVVVFYNGIYMGIHISRC